MEQLSGLDAAFIHQDSGRTPMHVTAVLLYYNGVRGNQRLKVDDLRKVVKNRLGKFPLFSRKLLRVPMGMDTPYWVDAGRVDPAGHIRESRLPRGSGWRDLQKHLARLHQEPMDLMRPLWNMELVHELTELPRLRGTHQALIFKAHHAAVDGMSLAAIVDAMHQTGRIRKQTYKAIAAPDSWDMWARLNENTIERQMRLADTARHLLPRLLKAREASLPFRDLPAISRSATPFNADVVPGRTTGAILVAFEEILAIKRSVRHVTLNDIAIAIVSGGLRAYLRHHGRLPKESLSCGAPISLRKAGDKDLRGNMIATMVVGMATNEEDPVERVRLIHRYALAGKRRIEALGTGTVMNISDSLPPGLLAGGLQLLGRIGRLADMPVPFHTMISNVAVPMHGQQRLGQAQLVVPLGLGPVRDNMGLFHIVGRGAEWFSIAFSACRQLLPDPARYEDFLAKSAQELHEAALSEGS